MVKSYPAVSFPESCLRLKAILADRDQIETLIFDEIDTGISGRTAQKVSEKMAVIGHHHQVLCITHLPQIAAMADSHFEIEKQVEGTKTTTQIHPLDEEASIRELARLLGRRPDHWRCAGKCKGDEKTGQGVQGIISFCRLRK